MQLISLFALLILPLSVWAQQWQTDIIAEAEKKSHAGLIHFKSSGTGANYDLKHHKLEWFINPDTLFVRGEVTSTFLTADAVTSLSFDLVSSLIVDSVIYNGSPLSFSLTNDILSIPLNNPIPAGQLDSVSVFYHGVPDSAGFGAFVKSRHANGPMIWTLSEPYSAKAWWPCKQDLNDKIDSIDIFITTPAQYKAAANGLLVDEQINGALITYHWKHRYPIAYYLIGIAVTNYAVYSDYVVSGPDSLEILNYVFPSDLAQSKEATRNIIPIMELFERLFEPYPFRKEKYGHAQFDWGGGMEHQTMSFMTNFGHELMAHELAHQWFGNKITCGSWHDIWLNEGFATYLTGLTYEHMFDGEFWGRWKQLTIDAVLSEPGGSVYVYDTTSVNRIFSSRLSYRKAALVLHMLRWKLGDVQFYEALRNYLADPALAYKQALTPDLQAHFEAVANENLTGFFDQWVYKEGYPVYDILWHQRSNGMIQLKITQETSHPSVDHFKMPVPVLLKNETFDTLVILDNKNKTEEFWFDVNFPVDSVVFDPDRWLLAASTVRKNEFFHPRDIAIDLYPNPAGNMLNLYISENTFEIEKLDIFSMYGEKVLSLDTRDNQSYHYQINISALPQGVYLIKAHVDFWFVAKRFVKGM